MRTTSKKLLGAVAVAGLVAAGGSAFTASNTLSGENVAGYGTDTVVGASTTVIEHTLAGDGQYVASTALTFTADLSAGSSVRAGFDDAAAVACEITEGGNGADTLADTPDDLVDTAVCTYAGASVLTSDSDTFQVSVS
jgi:hypothetical protein